MKKILIIGAKGMLGQALGRIFSHNNKYNIIAWDKDSLDITDKEKAFKLIKIAKPDIIINAAAYTNVNDAEKHKSIAMMINGRAVSYLARASHQSGAFFIHISTDYVFGQEKKQGYRENDIPRNPLNIYGKSKLLGEELLLQEGKKGLNYFLIRTSWLFGPNGKNFVQTMLNLAKEHKSIKVVNDQYGCPTYTIDLAETIKYMIEDSLESGIYHFTNEPKMTWYEFAKIIFSVQKEIDHNCKIPKLIPVKSEEFSSAAKRPKFSVLLNTKLPKGRNVKKAVEDYLKKEVKWSY